MLHLGDITKINGADAPVVDVVVGGSPCQDLSVAGKRAGLAGERSGLFMEQIRIVKEMREHDRRDGRSARSVRARYMLWENVPGALSSNKGEDFRAVLEETARIAEPQVSIPRPSDGKWTSAGCILGDGWSIAWRILDAQFWGVPQRRRRIALVADFGGQSAPEILFERNSLPRNPESCGAARKESPGEMSDTVRSVTADDRAGIGGVISLDRSAYNQGANAQFDIWISDDGKAQTVISKGPGAVAYDAFSFQERGGKPGWGKGILIQNDRIGALSTLQNQAVCYKANGDPGGDKTYTISGDHDNRPTDLTNLVVFRKKAHPVDSEQPQEWEETDKSDTLNVFDNTDARTPTVVVGVDGYNLDDTGDVEATLGVNCGMSTGRNGVAIMYDGSQVCPTLTANNADGSQRMPYKGNCNLVCYPDLQDKTGSLLASGYAKNGTQEIMNDMYVTQTIALEGNGSRPSHQGDGYAETDKSYTLNATEVHGVAYREDPKIRYVIRRLTTMEGERLQGYPDGWTDICDYIDTTGKKRKCSDSARYKAIGNTIALPQWKWVLKRISAQYERDATMASLFDGIGGFPYLWEQINGKGSCLWASEIDEFCIAVTERRINGHG